VAHKTNTGNRHIYKYTKGKPAIPGLLCVSEPVANHTKKPSAVPSDLSIEQMSRNLHSHDIIGIGCYIFVKRHSTYSPHSRPCSSLYIYCIAKEEFKLSLKQLRYTLNNSNVKRRNGPVLKKLRQKCSSES